MDSLNPLAEALFELHTRQGDTVVGSADAYLVLYAHDNAAPPLAEWSEWLKDESAQARLTCLTLSDYEDEFSAADCAAEGALSGDGLVDVEPAEPADPPVPMRGYADFVELTLPAPGGIDGDALADDWVARFYWPSDRNGKLALRDLVAREAERGQALDAGLIAGLYGALAGRAQPRPVADAVVRSYVRICGGLTPAGFGDLEVPDSAHFAHALLHVSADSLRAGDNTPFTEPVWVLPGSAWYRADALAHLGRVLWRPGCVHDLLAACALQTTSTVGSEAGAGPHVLVRVASESELLAFRARDVDEHAALDQAMSEVRLPAPPEFEWEGDPDGVEMLGLPLGEIAFLGYAADPGLAGDRGWMIDPQVLAGEFFGAAWLQWLVLTEADLLQPLDDDSAGTPLHPSAPYFLWPTRVLPSIVPGSLMDLDAAHREWLPGDKRCREARLALRKRLQRAAGQPGWKLVDGLPLDAPDARATGVADGAWQILADVPDSAGLARFGVAQIRLALSGDWQARFASFLESGRGAVLPVLAVGLALELEETDDPDGLTALSAVAPKLLRPLCGLAVTALQHDLVLGLRKQRPVIEIGVRGERVIKVVWAALAADVPDSGLARLGKVLAG